MNPGASSLHTHLDKKTGHPVLLPRCAINGEGGGGDMSCMYIELRQKGLWNKTLCSAHISSLDNK